MTLEIRSRGMSLDPDLRLTLERRLEFALGRFAPRIARVRLRLSDENGPRGGEDKLCRLEILGVRAWTVHLEARGRDVPVAVAHLAERASRSVERAIKREAETEPRRPRRGEGDR